MKRNLSFLLFLLFGFLAKSQNNPFIVIDTTYNYYVFDTSNAITINQFQATAGSTLRLSSQNGLQLTKIDTDQLGYIHYRYQRTIDNVPIELSAFYIHANSNGILKSANGDVTSTINVNTTTPNITSQTALNIVLGQIDSTKYRWTDSSFQSDIKVFNHDSTATYFPKADLLIAYINNSYSLCYKIDAEGASAVDSKIFYLSATNGQILKIDSFIPQSTTSFAPDTALVDDRLGGGENSVQSGCANDCQQGVASTGNYGEQYIYTQEFKYGCCQCTYRLKKTNCSGAPSWIYEKQHSNLSGVSDVREHHNNFDYGYRWDTQPFWCADVAYHYFKTTFNWEGYNNAATYIYMQSGNDNTSYQNGNIYPGTTSSGGTASLYDISYVYTQGIIDHTSHLNVADETIDEGSCLNRSFQNIFGLMVWIYGQNHYSNVSGASLSSLIPDASIYPTKYNGTNWVSPDPNNYRNDMSGNGSIQDYWFYLLCVGGSGTNDEIPYCVQAIGVDKASQIAFRTMTAYLQLNPTTNHSSFAYCRQYSIQSAADLYGANSPEVAQVTAAWYAVGVGANYSGTVDISNYTATGAENYSYNNEVRLINFSASSGSNVTVTSNTEVALLGESGINLGSEYSAYIAPGCANGARLASDENKSNNPPKSNLSTQNLETTSPASSSNLLDEKISNYKVYPNPSEDGNFTYIANDNLIGGTVTILNSIGKEIGSFTITTNQTLINLSVYESGIYLIKTSKNDGSASSLRVIKLQ